MPENIMYNLHLSIGLLFQYCKYFSIKYAYIDLSNPFSQGLSGSIFQLLWLKKNRSDLFFLYIYFYFTKGMINMTILHLLVKTILCIIHYFCTHLTAFTGYCTKHKFSNVASFMLHRGSRSKEWEILWLLQGAVPRCDFHGGDAETDAILRSKSAYSLCAHLYSGPAGLPVACWLRREDLSWWARHSMPLSSF